MKKKRKIYMEAMEAWAEGLKGIKNLNFCGCGDPDSGYAALLETLKAHDEGGERRKWAEARGGSWEEVQCKGNGYDYLILYFLDANGLMEHGGSVGGGWLTKKGKSVRIFLEEWGTDSDEWPEDKEFG